MDYLGPLKSELKQQILLSLLKGEKKLGELHAEIQSSESTILHIIKEFEGLSLTSRTGKTYQLTSLGLLEAQMCKNATAAAAVIEKFKDFWLLHDLTGIPPSLMSKIGSLKDSTLVRAELLELGNVHKAVLEILMTSPRLKGISPIFHPDYVPVIENLLSKGIYVELIFTSGVLNKTLELTKLDTLKKNITEGTLKIFINENPKVALTVTDKNFSLGLFEINGKYDYNMDLVSISQDAIGWGDELFQNCLTNSRRIEPEATM